MNEAPEFPEYLLTYAFVFWISDDGVDIETLREL